MRTCFIATIIYLIILQSYCFNSIRSSVKLKQNSREQILMNCFNLFSDMTLFSNHLLLIKQRYIITQIEKILRGRFKKSEDLERYCQE